MAARKLTTAEKALTDEQREIAAGLVPLAEEMATFYLNRLARPIARSIDDTIRSAAYEGCCIAARTHRPDGKASLKTWAFTAIRSAMTKAFLAERFIHVRGGKYRLRPTPASLGEPGEFGERLDVPNRPDLYGTDLVDAVDWLDRMSAGLSPGDARVFDSYARPGFETKREDLMRELGVGRMYIELARRRIREHVEPKLSVA